MLYCHGFAVYQTYSLITLSDTRYFYGIYRSGDDYKLNVDHLVFCYYEYHEIMLKIKAVRRCEIINICICSVCAGSNELNTNKMCSGGFHHSLVGILQENSREQLSGTAVSTTTYMHILILHLSSSHEDPSIDFDAFV